MTDVVPVVAGGGAVHRIAIELEGARGVHRQNAAAEDEGPDDQNGC
jgi:hypothetical protein